MESDARLDELLDPSKLRLPDSPRVLKILHEPYIDSLGLEGVRVWVIMPDDTTDEERLGPNVRAIRSAILDAVLKTDLPGWADVWFRTESEYADDRPYFEGRAEP